MRRLGNASALVMALALGAACGGRSWEHPFIVAKLRAVPGVSVTGARLLESNSGATYAYVLVNGKGLLAFASLTLDSFRPGSPLRVWQVGDHRPRIVRFGESAGRPGKSPSFSNSLDVSSTSAFDSVLPVHSSAVADVVGNYDGLLGFLESWPACPTSAALRGSDGAEYRYCAQRGAGNAYVDPDYPAEWDTFGES